MERIVGTEIDLVDNADWLGQLRLTDFLRDVGGHFRVNDMMAKDSVRARLERDQGISYKEFSYMLLQAYDFWHLCAHRGCRLQVGGSDQWGNITAGIDLIHRRARVQAYGMTFPLVTRADGSKFGKSEGGNLWLDPARTSPYEFFQFWLRVGDADVGRYLRLFTWLDRERIEELEAAVAEHPERREAQRVLAREVTAAVHGAAAAEAAEQAGQALFGGELGGLDGPTPAGGVRGGARHVAAAGGARGRGRAGPGGPAGGHRAGGVEVGGPDRDRAGRGLRQQPAGGRRRPATGALRSAGRFVPRAPEGQAQLPPGALGLRGASVNARLPGGGRGGTLGNCAGLRPWGTRAASR